MDEDKQFEQETTKTTVDTEEAPVDSTADTVPEAVTVEDAPVEESTVSEAESTEDEEIDPTVIEAEAAAAAAQATDSPEAAIAMLKATAEAAQSQLEDLNLQYARLAADFDNYRKRTHKEKADLEEQAKCNTLKELLPVVDNFERARTQIKPQTDGETNIHKSYQSVYKQMVDCLKRLGVAPMRPEGEEFDPNLHDAVMREATDAYPDGTVTEELMRGYTLGERVLRHAMVKVATAAEPVVSSGESDTEASDS
ncbi:nucleotide exchange factor GrpE [Sodalinema gerasimenkoae]|uniref:nucleotide exchange factor GrpE n=1 Tax=Sodalinema gerasimenkoae TaxID=2862348 RepID=UPI001358EAD4|nr:nucleotide exchange factor GrpE [Sodalinema gerasimenkoae]